MSKRPTLYEIGNKYHTDKSWYHLFTVLYGSYFDIIRDNDIRMLEIGILAGSSLMMWNEYFTNLTYFGVDLADYSQYNTEKVKTIIANQESINELRDLPKELDIILDDGGHTMLQQQFTLKTLFIEHLKSGGTYIIEDLHTSEEYYYPTHGSTPHNNTLKLCRDIQNHNLSSDSNYFITETEFYKLCSLVESLEIIKVKDDSITSRIIKR